jgi:hypothetical protein
MLEFAPSREGGPLHRVARPAKRPTMEDRLGRHGGRWLPLLAGAWLLPAAFACGGGGGGTVEVLDPGRKEMHRLNSTEYNATIQDVLGTNLQPASGTWRAGELGGFDNQASVLGVDEIQYDRYFNAARDLATEVMASEELRGRFISCTLSDPGCAKSSIETAGLRLFRRPLDPKASETYQRVYDAARALGDDEAAAFTLTLQALLSSAEFLYRTEIDPDPASTQPHPLDAFELASRLSYFLWSSAPDVELLGAATDGSLTQPATLGATVDRMLKDRRSERLVANFAGQWLGAREVLSHPVAATFPHWSPQFAKDAGEEMLLYFSDFLTSGRSWFEFPTADINFVNPALAYFYGDLPTTSIDTRIFERIEYHGDRRKGFFGLVGFLAVSSFDRRTSPSRRGRWIAANMLCAAPRAPPPNIPELEVAAGGPGDLAQLNIRQILERHRTNPGCAGCHQEFDAYGLALEEFDAIGRYRSSYEDGTPIDVAVTLPPSPTHPNGLTFSGLDGLADAVSSDPRFGACLARKLLTYGLGRSLTVSDEPHLQRAVATWLTPGETPSIRRLVQALIASEAFRLRRGGG